MAKEKRYIALDFGPSAGEAVAGCFNGKTVALDRLHRFSVQSTDMLGTRYWDFPALIINAKRGMRAYSAAYGPDVAGVACSSWAVDFGLLDKNGQLLANPVHFMDKRTIGVMDKLHALIPERSLYQKTGTKSRRHITLYQLFAMALANSPLLDKAVTMLLIADLVSYFLSGTPVQEYTLATTTGMYDGENSDWSRDVILSAKIPPVMVPEIIAPGTMIGPLLDTVAAECGLGMLPVIAPASHAVADAVAAVPVQGDDDWAYAALDYYLQIGVEVSEPIINDDGFSADFTNEGGVDGSFRFAKTILGTALLERLAAEWGEEDQRSIGLDELVAMAAMTDPCGRFIQPDDPVFAETEDTVRAIDAALTRSGQPRAESRADYVRVCIDSLAMAIRHALAQLTEITGKRYGTLYVIGAAAGNPALCQMVADATGMPVKAGPVEARTLGNILMQGIALGDIGSLAEAREIVANSFAIGDYQPAEAGRWNDAYGRFCTVA